MIFWEFLKGRPMSSVDDFFRSRLDQMIDLRHPLAILASRMPWLEIEAALASQLARQAKAGKPIEALDLFGAQTVVVGGGRSNAGRPRLPIRLMVSLLYLKHAFNESDEGVVERWSETPTWQYFSGMDYFEHRLPCDATLIGKFRRLLGEAGVEELLSQTIRVAIDLRRFGQVRCKAWWSTPRCSPRPLPIPPIADYWK